MSELDELIKQKKELEKRIKELKTSEVRVGRAKYHIFHHNNYKGDEYCVSIKLDRWNRVLGSFSREELIKDIPKLVDDLTNLHKKLQ